MFSSNRDPLPVDEAGAGRLHAEENVLRNGEIGGDGEFLVNHAHTGVERIAGGAEADLASLDLHRAGEIGVHTGDDLHQGRFSGSVFADKAVDFAGAERKVDAAQRLDAAERFGNAGKLEKRRPARSGVRTGVCHIHAVSLNRGKGQRS